MKKKDYGEIEPLAVNSMYNDETFFSIFGDHGIIYEIFYDQIRKLGGLSAGSDDSKAMISVDEFQLFMRRLRYVITRPTPVYDQT